MKQTIIQLIQQDIKHTQFIEGLNTLGLTADPYYLNLCTIVFELMQLDRSTAEQADALQDGYFQLIHEIVTAQTTPLLLQKAQHVYCFLERFQKGR